MKRYDIEGYEADWNEAETKDGEYVKYDEALERENKLIDMIIINNAGYCPEKADLTPDRNYTKENCGGEYVKCKECWKIAIENSLKSN